MAIPPKKFRELLFQLLCTREFSPEEDPSRLLMDLLKVAKSCVSQAKARADRLSEHLDVIDQKIKNSLKAYDFQRISCVERNILRLGVFELLFDDEIPPKVAISEAIRLMRKFGSPEAGCFVNAVLDGLYQKED